MANRLLALKIDVDTWRGTREGVPRLLDLLQKHGARATFLFSLGPDHTGRAIKRVFRKGFLQKVSRTSVVEHYGLRTLLYGTLLPAPDIGRREAALMRSVDAAGHETGVHCWDHIRWQDYVTTKNADWTRREMQRASERYTQIFNKRATTHGAAGWQMNDAAFAFEREQGFAYASDVRGSHPFQPVDAQGYPVGVPQIPTNLPTLDELIGLDGLDATNVHEHLLKITRAMSETPVYTLHAELEGMRLATAFERLIIGWRDQGYRLAACRDVFDQLIPERLPRHRVVTGSVPGRSGLLATQGPPVGRTA